MVPRNLTGRQIAALPTADRIFARYAPVCGVGITRRDHEYAVKVNLEAEPASDEELPDQIDGVPVVVHVVGRIRKQAGAAR